MVVLNRPFDRFDRVGVDVYQLLSMCDTVGHMPRAGGLFDQDSLFVHLYWNYKQAVQERQALDNKSK